jgi:vancomycin permeability regulator SanA
MKKTFTTIIEFFKKLKDDIKDSPFLRRSLTAVLCIAVLVCSAGAAVMTVSLSIKASMSDRVITVDEAAMLEDVDLILVLGAGLRSDGSPSDMLADRLRISVSLMEKNFCTTVLMSGDNSGENYNEVAAMSKFAIESGVPAEAVVTDGEGFSTYESVSHAINEYGAKKIVIVTQEYHLYRALYIAKALGAEAYGVSADLNTYRGQAYRDIREHLARLKDFLITIEKD